MSRSHRKAAFYLPALVCAPVIVVLLLVGVRQANGQPVQRGPVRADVARRIDVNVLDLASVRRLFHALARDRAALGDGELVAVWTDVSLVIATVAGRDALPAADVSGLTFEDLAIAASTDARLMVAAVPGVGQRDATADMLLALGYSARETADVISRRISQHALDTARRMIAVGGNPQQAADYLDSRYKQALALFTAPRPEAGGVRGRQPGVFDALIERYAALHRVESDIVRAIIATESDFNPVARSRAGAIGLMQLMPGTARELGVNPLVPEQNIEGGVRYFSHLVRMFGTLELALVAYNAGPGFATRYARGQTGLYGETREYVARVLTRLEDPPSGPVRKAIKPGRLVGH